MPTIVICKKCRKEKEHHGRGLCDACYQEEYRQEHKPEVQEYRKEYRADPAYKELNRLYVAKYRKRD